MKCTRVNRHEVLIHYSSPRRMCHVAVGICKGVAKRFEETLTIAQRRCMLRGDASCEIRVAVMSQVV